MPLYEFRCATCGASFDKLAPVGSERRKCSCGKFARRQFSCSFNLGNITDVSGTRFAGWEVGLGERPKDTRDAERILKEQGVRPAEEYRYQNIKPGDKRKEITEEELHDVLVERIEI